MVRIGPTLSIHSPHYTASDGTKEESSEGKRQKRSGFILLFQCISQIVGGGCYMTKVQAKKEMVAKP